MTPDAPDSGEIKLHFLDYWRVIRVRLPLIVLVFLLVTVSAGVITYFMPKLYSSTVTMQIRQNDTIMQVFDQGRGQMLSPTFLSTQFQIIQRKEILYPVIQALGLDRKWGIPNMEQAYIRLSNSIQVREIRNTELINITVYSTDPKEAMEIANLIAEEYQKRRIAETRDWLNKSLTQLEDEVAKQQLNVENLQQKATKLRMELGINDLSPDIAGGSAQSADQAVLLSVEEQVSNKGLEYAVAKASAEKLDLLTDDELMRSFQKYNIQDPILDQILPQYQEAVSEEARMLNGGLAQNHPSVRSLRAKKNAMFEQINAQVKVLRKNIKDNLVMKEMELVNLRDKLKESREGQMENKTRATSYYDAKNAYLQARNVLEAAEMRLSTEKMQRQMPQSPATIWERAEAAQNPTRPRVMLNMILGVMVGLISGVGIAFFIEYLDTSVKTMEDVEAYLKVPVLAVIPKGISMLIDDPDSSADAEAYRILRTNIEFNRKNPEANTITIVSGGAGEGKSTTMANLACIFASGGYSTLIVDADLRRPSQHRNFGVENNFGLSDFLTTDIRLEEVVTQTRLENLYLMCSGKLPSDAVGILNSQRMVDLIEEVKNRFDIVFFDSPPILGVSDASVLSSAVDLTIIVVQHRRFPRAMLQRVKQAILNVGGNILGVVLNNVDVRHDQHYQYYTSYYNYYYQKPDRKGAEKKVKPKPKKKTDTTSNDESRDRDNY